MNAMTRFEGDRGTAARMPGTSYDDPLHDDAPTDAVVRTTRRGLVRLALVAVETGARFQREGVAHDPMSWLLAPRTLFEGAAAIDACLSRDACVRGILIHGLSLGLDADPEMIDALVADDEGVGPSKDQDRRSAAVLPFARPAASEPRLYTATVVSHDGGEIIQAFHASVATEEAEVAGRLHCRMGAASSNARIFVGFDPDDPLVAALVSSAMCDTLALIAEDPASPLAAGLDITVEQRFLG